VLEECYERVHKLCSVLHVCSHILTPMFAVISDYFKILKETECLERDGWCLPDTMEKCRAILAQCVRSVAEAGKLVQCCILLLGSE
jgi:hypothetical protein